MKFYILNKLTHKVLRKDNTWGAFDANTIKIFRSKEDIIKYCVEDNFIKIVEWHPIPGVTKGSFYLLNKETGLYLDINGHFTIKYPSPSTCHIFEGMEEVDCYLLEHRLNWSVVITIKCRAKQRKSAHTKIP